MSSRKVVLSKKELKKLWPIFNEMEQGLVFCVFCLMPPVSIDTLGAISETSAVIALNVMETLRKKGIVRNKKKYGKGVYFFDNNDFGDDLEDLAWRLIAEEKAEQMIQRIIDFYINSSGESVERTLLLAKLFLKISVSDEGLLHIQEAADIFCRAHDRKKAEKYYDYILAYFEDKDPTRNNVEIFLKSVLAKAATNTDLKTVSDHMSLLNRAEAVAKKFEKWELLAMLKTVMKEDLIVAGQIGKAAKCVEELRELTSELVDPHIHKLAVLAKCELLFFEGKISEATSCYDEVTGDLEEFGDNEATLRIEALMGWCYVQCGRIARGMGMIDAVRAKAQVLEFQEIAVTSDLLEVHSHLESRKVFEAEAVLRRIEFSLRPGSITDRLIEWSIFISWAYVFCVKKDFKRALEFHKKSTECLPSQGWKPRKTPWMLTCLLILESQGMISEMVYEEELAILLKGPDIYLKGVAFRYKARRNIKKQRQVARVPDYLRKSEELLQASGAEIELSRTLIALGRYFLEKRDKKTAQSYLEKAWKICSSVDKGLFPSDLMPLMPHEHKTEFMMNRIVAVTGSLGKLRDASSFLERALNVAMDFTMARRGVFIEVDSENTKIIASRNMDPLFLNMESFQNLGKSLQTAAQQGEEVMIPGPVNKSSIVFREILKKAGIHSFMITPAKLGEYCYGYICLDNRLDGTPFPEDELPFIRILCSQIAVGLSNISMYNEMKELKERFEEEAIFYKQEMGVARPIEEIIGISKSIKQVIDKINQVAPTDSTVLILGETGVGKELVAKAIHNLSTRKDGPFIPVNLATIPLELVDSELFGHEKGAFTGASARQKGRFELADGGTIFIDEIGDCPPGVQVKLLRVLQEGVFERLGGSKHISPNFRVIAATNKNLRMAVEKEAFRQDLYYRLAVFPIHISPLRERREDIPHLVHHFLNKYNRKLGKKIRRVSSDEMKKLLSHHWPGNVRELEHVIEKAAILSDGIRIGFSEFDYVPINPGDDDSLTIVSLHEHDRKYILKVLKAVQWKVAGPNGAASLLGLNRTTLLSRMKKLGIKRPRRA